MPRTYGLTALQRRIVASATSLCVLPPVLSGFGAFILVALRGYHMCERGNDVILLLG